MTKTTEAIYEQGVLRLLEPMSLVDGTRVEVIIISSTPTPESNNPADILAAIAAMPLGEGVDFSGRDHDQVLYGQQGAR
ncbi:MAG: hypothetical protein Fur0044_12760 [Anaerolineae bacterium]|nr:antitoxin family protein [Anaerolineales bacterium]MCQ3980386.1 hypothetical protein [Anaerolineae bacterium]